MSEKTYSELTEEELAMMEAEALKLFDDNSTSSVSKDYIKQNSAQIIELSKLLGFDADFLSDFENFLSDDENTENYEEIPIDNVPDHSFIQNVKLWGNTLFDLSKVVIKAFVDEYKNENSPFKEKTPIPEWLDVFSSDRQEVKNLVGEIGNNFEYLTMWRTIILNSSFQGFITVFEFRRLHIIDRKYHNSIAHTAIRRAKKGDVPYYEKTNEWNVTTYAYPINFLTEVCIYKGYL